MLMMRPYFFFHHQRNHLLADMEGPGQIDGDVFVPAVERLLKKFYFMTVAGEIDGHIDATQFSPRFGDKGFHRPAIGDIAFFSDDLYAECTGLCGHRIEFVDTCAGADRQISAFAREGNCRDAAHVATRASDQHGLAFEAGIQWSSPLFCPAF